jgi:hypothetical protein
MGQEARVLLSELTSERGLTVGPNGRRGDAEIRTSGSNRPCFTDSIVEHTAIESTKVVRWSLEGSGKATG